jgi:hypothetical protein
MQLLHQDHVQDNTLCLRFTLSFLFQAHSSISDHGEDMKKLSVCTNVDGMVVRRPMAHLTT